jgi:hypothetical protein
MSWPTPVESVTVTVGGVIYERHLLCSEIVGLCSVVLWGEGDPIGRGAARDDRQNAAIRTGTSQH